MGRRIALLITTSEYTDPELRRLRALAEEGPRLRELLWNEDIGGFDQVVLAPNHLISANGASCHRMGAQDPVHPP